MALNRAQPLLPGLGLFWKLPVNLVSESLGLEAVRLPDLSRVQLQAVQ